MRARSAQYAALLRPTHYRKVLAAALARMRRYRTHHPHRNCGWLRQAKAAESVIAVPAFYFPAAQPVARLAKYRTIRPAQYAALSRALRSCFVSRASEISRPGRDKTTRRANHPKPVQTFAQKYFAFAVGQITDLTSRVSPDERGGSRSSRTRGGMRWTRWRRMTNAAVADGEAVWS